MDEHISGDCLPRPLSKSGPLYIGGLLFMKISIRQISIAAVMAALSIILSVVSVKTDTSKFTIEGFPLMVAGILYGPLTGGLAGLVAGFISQVIFYGITPTTPLWMLSSLVWGISGGLFHFWLRRNYHSLLAIIVAVFTTSLLVTSVNTAAMVLDGVIYGYNTAYVWVNLIYRVAVSLILAVGYVALLFTSLPRLAKAAQLPTNKTTKIVISKVDKETSILFVIISVGIFLTILFLCMLLF